MGAGGICGRSDRLDDNIGKPCHACELLCDANRIANCDDLLFATRAAQSRLRGLLAVQRPEGPEDLRS